MNQNEDYNGVRESPGCLGRTIEIGLAILLLVTMCSCGTPMRINGIAVKRSHVRQTDSLDKRVLIGAAIVGLWIGSTNNLYKFNR